MATIDDPQHRIDALINPEAQAREISRFEEEIRQLEAQKLDMDNFRRFRLENGIYGIRGTMDEHMVRVKIRFGLMTADQLDAIADVADQYATPKVAHITTRQAIQMHRLKRPQVPAILKRLTKSGLTTREACGNTVRNVSACPYAGLSAEELFDVVPYADAVSRYFLRHPVCQNLPRKFKIAFEGCPTDHARVGIHDFGAVARIQMVDGKEVRGFKTFVGGGLGTVPFQAHVLEEFTPADKLIPTIEAVIRLFDRFGDRKNKNTARIKFLIKKWGIDEFRKQFEDERNATIMTRPGSLEWDMPVYEQAAPPKPKSIPSALPVQTEHFQRWKDTNVLKQKQAGYFSVQVRCLLGDITVPQMHGVAKIARAYSGGHLRTVISQNLLIPWVPEAALQAVYNELAQLNLAQSDAGSVADVTRCPGADTCQIAITRSRGLAQAVGDIFTNGGAPFVTDPVLKNLTIKISGCPNSCGQHHIADLGFHGASSELNGHMVPHYQVLVGGRTAEGVAQFGYRLGMIPAKRVSEAIKKLLDLYKTEKQGTEQFRAWVERLGVERLKKEMDPFRVLPAFSEKPELYEDLGATGVFKLEVGKGECAA